MMTKVYAIVSYDMLEYCKPVFIHEVYSTREAAERHKPKDDEFAEYAIKEWEVLDD